MKARWHIHQLIDPAWNSGKFKRKNLYERISEKLGYEFHAAEIRTIEDAQQAYQVASEIVGKL